MRDSVRSDTIVISKKRMDKEKEIRLSADTVACSCMLVSRAVESERRSKHKINIKSHRMRLGVMKTQLGNATYKNKRWLTTEVVYYETRHARPIRCTGEGFPLLPSCTTADHRCFRESDGTHRCVQTMTAKVSILSSAFISCVVTAGCVRVTLVPLMTLSPLMPPRSLSFLSQTDTFPI